MPPIIYLHGFASGPSSTKARYFRELFARDQIAMETPDLAEGDFEGLTLTRQLGVVERVAGGRAVSLIGSSMGGYLAALYAARHPEVVRVVLLAPAFGFARRWTAALSPAAEEWKRTGKLEIFHYAEKRPRAVGWQLIEDGYQYEDEPEFVQPGLICHGTRDTHVPPEWSAKFARARPGVRLELVDCGHEMIEVLEQIGPKVREFLGGA